MIIRDCMSLKFRNVANPLDVATHLPFPIFQAPIWAFTQGFAGFNAEADHQMTANGDGTYSVTIPIVGPTYSAMQYLYGFGTDSANMSGTEMGGGFEDLGRRRERFIKPNPDGSWPATYEIDVEVYQPEGNLPFDANPASTGTNI